MKLFTPRALTLLILIGCICNAAVVITYTPKNTVGTGSVAFTEGTTGITISGTTATGFELDVTGNDVLQVQGPIRGQNPLSTVQFASLPGHFFTTLRFNPFMTVDGLVSVQANGATGTFNIDGNGQNFFTIQSTGGELLHSVVLTVTGATRIESIHSIGLVTATPEPGTIGLALIGLGLVGAGVRRRLK